MAYLAWILKAIINTWRPTLELARHLTTEGRMRKSVELHLTKLAMAEDKSGTRTKKLVFFLVPIRRIGVPFGSCNGTIRAREWLAASIACFGLK